MTELSLGAQHSGTISAAGEIDTYRFQAASGDVVTLTLGLGSGFSVFDPPQAALYTPSGELVQTWNANGRRDFSLAETGVYVIEVYAASGSRSGSYGVSGEGLSPVSADATTLALGKQTVGSISGPAEVDAFVFDGNASDVVTLALGVGSGFSVFDPPQAALYTPSGELVQTWNANGDMEVTLEETGRHVVQVYSADLARSGAYELLATALLPGG